jgi:hypothetical protein
MESPADRKTAEIIHDLALPMKSFRIFALEQAIQEGASEELLHTLEKRLAVEDDEECRLLLEYALQAVRQRLQPATENSDLCSAEHFLPASDNAKMQFLKKLPAQEVKGLASRAVEWLQNSRDSIIGALIVRRFGLHWPMEQLGMLQQKLRSPSFSMRLAVLETLVKRSPDLLAHELPELLTHADRGVRSLAIRGLAIIDPIEAMAFVEHMLMSQDSSERLSGIKTCIHLPFDLVKPLLYKYCSVEKNPVLLEKAGLIFAINPDKEVPFRLWEMFENAVPPRKETLNQIINEACRVIHDSGILGDRYKAYIANLQRWAKKRLAERFLRELLLTVEQAGEAEACLVDPLGLRKQLINPYFRQVLQEASQWKLSGLQKESLNLLLELVEPAPGPAAGASASPAASASATGFQALPGPEKIKLLAGFSAESPAEVRELVGGLLRDDKTPPELLVAALKGAARSGEQRFLEPVTALVKHPRDEVACAALESLAQLGPEKLVALLNGLLATGSDRVKLTSLRLLQTGNSVQAAAVLAKWLKSKKPNLEKLAVGSAGYFDFSLIRDDLAEYLETCSDIELFKTAIALFEVNSAHENLAILQFLQRVLPSEKAELAQKALKKNEDDLLNMELVDQHSLQEIRQKNETKAKQTQERGKKAPSPYSFQTLHPTAGGDQPGMFETMGPLLPTLGGILVVFLAACGIATLMVGRPSPGASAPGSNQAPVTLQQEKNIIGSVEEIRAGSLVVVRTDDARTYVLVSDAPTVETLVWKDKIQAVVIPTVVSSDGTITARVKSLEKR